MTIEELKNKYPNGGKLFSYMFYGQPGIRDMEILAGGIRFAYNNDDYNGEIISFDKFMQLNANTSMPLHILAEEISEDQARIYDVNRGWLIRFAFGLSPKRSDDFWKEHISLGLKELRVEHKFLFIEDIGETNV